MIKRLFFILAELNFYGLLHLIGNTPHPPTHVLYDLDGVVQTHTHTVAYWDFLTNFLFFKLTEWINSLWESRCIHYFYSPQWHLSWATISVLTDRLTWAEIHQPSLTQTHRQHATVSAQTWGCKCYHHLPRGSAHLLLGYLLCYGCSGLTVEADRGMALLYRTRLFIYRWVSHLHVLRETT